MKLGYINYLNCYPFYYDMLEKSPLPDVEIVPGYPGELNRMMVRQELDISPISAAAYADVQADVLLLPDFCLSSVGYVRSVILNSRVPIESLHHKSVGLSRASQTSVALLKILLKKYYKVEPHYLPTAPKPSLKAENLDAALIIGNEAIMQCTEPVPYTYDLGDLWLRKTGYPVVFAVFAVRESAVKKFPSQVSAVVKSYHQSLECLESERELLIGKAAERYPNIQYDIHTYYNLLQYNFTAEMKSALDFYFRLGGEMGVLEEVNMLRFMDSIKL